MRFLEWLGVTSVRQPLQVGDPAPEVEALDEQGNVVCLADFYHDATTLVYFYPKADTPGCTAQACNLRDEFDELRNRGVRVFGVSTDKPEAQRRFKEKYKLPFTLLADSKGVVAQAFGVRLILGMTHRQSFLIKRGRIIWRDLHASTRQQALDVFKALENNPSS